MDNFYLDLDLTVENVQFTLDELLYYVNSLLERDPNWDSLKEYKEKIKKAKLLLKVPEDLEEVIAEEEERFYRMAEKSDGQSY